MKIFDHADRRLLLEMDDHRPHFVGGRLVRADVSGHFPEGMAITRCLVRNGRGANTHLSLTTFSNCRIVDFESTGLSAYGVAFDDCRMKRCKISGALMYDCEFCGSLLRKIDFSGEFISCKFFDCTFINCEFASMGMKSVVFKKCRLSASPLGPRDISEVALVNCQILD